MNTIFSNQCLRKHSLSALSIPFCSFLQSPPLHLGPFSSQNPLRPTKTSKSHKRLRFLDLVTPKLSVIRGGRQTHLRLIQDILRTTSHEPIDSNSKEGPISMLFRLNREGLRANPIVLSHALSSCGCPKTVFFGIQVHCLAIKTGFFTNVYIGSSLISFYCKCGELGSGYQVFDEMPMRNVVSWTTMITGFAQEWKIDMCLELYHRMRNSTAKPNEFTLTSLLSACTGNGCLGHGRIAHCQAMQMGFDSYLHVSNALISFYCKCGDVQEASYIFQNMPAKDLVSWNSMIAGYAYHGLALQAIDLFEEMKKERVRPDGITFLGVLSSCRHGGLVEQGRFYLNSMVEFGFEPEVEHYSCIVDLLGRAGEIEESQEFIKKMHVDPNAIIWGSLLSSCRLHGNVWIGIEAAENRLVLEPKCASTHLQLVNLYASVGFWDQVARVRRLMRDKGLKTDPGYSWIEIRNEVCWFRAEDSSNSKEITGVVDCLVDHMRSLGCVAETYQLECGYDRCTDML
ncbi:unnamed protein product [Camellia sinensis]